METEGGMEGNPVKLEEEQLRGPGSEQDHTFVCPEEDGLAWFHLGSWVWCTEEQPHSWGAVTEGAGVS